MIKDVILVAPSLDPNIALGGVSSVARFIVNNNNEVNYYHFEQGRRDKDKGGILRIFRILRNYRKWKRILKEREEKIVHYNFDLSPGSVIRDFPFMRYARIKEKFLVIHVHGGVYMNSSKVPFIIDLFLKKIFSWSDVLFIVLSNREKQVLETRYGTKNIYVLPNCTELPKLNCNHSFTNNLHIGYLGRITETKGMGELLKASIRLKEENVPFVLSFAGKKEPPVDYVDLFSKELGSRFQYVGIVSGEKKEEFLRNLDVFVLPSYFEGLPISLLESMSYGVIPVVTSVGSIPEHVDNGMNGLLIKDHDIDSIVDAIKKISNNMELAIKLSTQAADYIKKHFSPSDYITKLNSIYTQYYKQWI